MKAIIFGANGQDGFYLTQLLTDKKIEVIGISRRGNFLNLNMADYAQITALIKKETPDYIFHLAANSTTRHEALFENHETIATGTLHILEAVKNFSPHTKVFISGSGLQFKNENKPIKETDDFEARDAYSISRIQSVFAARYYRRLGLQVYVGYFFNHDSPRRSERHMAKKISAFAQRIARGREEVLEIGDATVIKEWSFAGDIVKGIWLLVNQHKIYEANISSGLGYSIRQWIEACFACIAKNPQGYFIYSNYFKAEYKCLVSDAGRIQSLGYKPEVSFSQLAKMMVESDS